MSPSPPPPPPSSSPPPRRIDPRSGYCAETKTFHSLRPPAPIPPAALPVSFPSYAFSRLPSPLPSYPLLLDAATGAAVSFAAFLSQARSLSAALRSHLALRPGAVAFVLSPARLDIPVLYFSLLSVGAVVSPSDPSLTAGEVSRLVALSNPSVAFAVSSSAAKLPAGLPTVLLDSPQFEAFLHVPCEEEGTVLIRQSDPAAVLYSSGTTGRAKAAVLTHGNLIASVASLLSTAPSEAPVVMLTVPLFHVYGFVFSLKAVAAAETLVVQTARFDVGAVLKAVERFQVTRLALAPPALLTIVRAAEEGGVAADVSSLRLISCGSAPVSANLIRRFLSKFPHASVAQGYGMTESTSGFCRAVGLEECQRIGSSGRPSWGCEVKIVDPLTGVALPPGMLGEVWVRGPPVMQGYLGDKESTSATLDSEGWLKTSDLCYIDNDGFLYYVDRLKELIKYKGYQVPPAELEHLLQNHPDIIEAAVVPYPDDQAGELPVAVVVRRFGSNLNETQIKEFVAKQVAPYKRIHHVLFVSSIPKNAAGKMLRKKLVKLLSPQINSKL